MANHPNRTRREEEEKNLPATTGGALQVYDFGDEVDAVMEARREEQVIPFLRMAQGLSPELNPSKGQYIQGLKLGEMFNTATHEIYDGKKGVSYVAFWKDYHFGQWVPRDLGGGFRGALPPDDPLVQTTLARMRKKYGSSAKFKMPRYDGKLGRWSDDPPKTKDTDEPIELVETGQIYIAYAPERVTYDNHQLAIVAFTRTALPQYNDWVTRHMNRKWLQKDGTRKPAMTYAYRWKLSTFQDSRKAGEFFNWRTELSAPFDPPTNLPKGATYDRYRESLIEGDDPLRDLVRDLWVQSRDNIIRPDYETGREDVVDGGGSGPAIGDDDVPF